MNLSMMGVIIMQYCKVLNTLNTVRIKGYNHIEIAVKSSEISYAASHPNAIILVSDEKWQDAYAACPLVHHPINAPILFTSKDYLYQKTLDQILDLNPAGYNGIDIFLIGEISHFVEEHLNYLGFTTFRIEGKDFYELSANIAAYQEYPQDIIVISADDYREGMSICSFVAHAGATVLFTKKDCLSKYTKKVIQLTNNPNIYIVGSFNTISTSIEDEISRLNIHSLDRISGGNPYEIAVNFAKYRDYENELGWGRTYRDGHGFTFVSIYRPLDSPASALFGHLGKHTPTLCIDPNYLPDVTDDYIESVKPIPLEEPTPPFMHGWIIGCNNIIAYETQLQIENVLSIDEHHMHM